MRGPPRAAARDRPAMTWSLLTGLPSLGDFCFLSFFTVRHKLSYVSLGLRELILLGFLAFIFFAFCFS